ncbi:MAG: glyceraldehyde-3-phosphate dehydrogenase [Bacteroidetes bacterium]|jgi:glyceraldehyde 3-phosphate dehydrogenase|nr:glyceraldehyde-3-phosphate dehydrogenase [Bacteroidota bacterium]MBK8367544.1 glyceraldehyde-3-phosphate dehydrogenase [Bacteroidota bacterium]
MQTKETANAAYQTQLNDWIVQEKAAIELIGTIGKLWFEKSIELILFRNQLVDRSVSEMMNLHLYAKNIVKKTISVNDTLAIATAINNADVCPSRIDIGKLAFEYQQEIANFKSVDEFIANKLKDLIGAKTTITPKDVILYGFGRIGRLAARELISQAGKGEQLRLRAIVTRGSSDDDIIKRADLLRTDSVHGVFPGTVIEDLENKALIINGHTVHMIDAKNPEDVDYTAYGIDNALVIDNTGVFRDDVELSRHLKAKGVSKVLLTAPAKGNVPNVVHGINHETVDVKNGQIFSAASCTTNAIMPILYVIDKELGIQKGHIETVHSYTNDQNLLDNYHKKYRRGRSAALNMVITETGAESALKKVLPHLAGKFTANSVRVPTPNVSLAILNLNINKEVTRDEVNEIIRKYALNGALVEQIQYAFSNELVSSDVIGNPCPSVFDSNATIISPDKKSIVLYVWYDNEYGYTRQVIRFSKHIAEVRRATYY